MASAVRRVFSFPSRAGAGVPARREAHSPRYERLPILLKQRPQGSEGLFLQLVPVVRAVVAGAEGIQLALDLLERLAAYASFTSAIRWNFASSSSSAAFSAAKAAAASSSSRAPPLAPGRQ